MDTELEVPRQLNYCCGYKRQTDKKKNNFCKEFSKQHKDVNHNEGNNNTIVDGRPCHEVTYSPYLSRKEITRRNQIAVPVRNPPDEPEKRSENPVDSVRPTPARTGKDRKAQVKWKETLVNEEDMHFFDITHPDNVVRNLSCTTGRPRLRPVAKIKSETDKVYRPVDAATTKEPWEEFVSMYKTKLAIRNAYSLALHMRTWNIETGHIEDKPENGKSRFSIGHKLHIRGTDTSSDQLGCS